MPSIKPNALATLVLGLAAAWSCTVVNKDDYEFTDNPSEGGDSGEGAGGSSASGGKGGVGGKGGAAGKAGAGGRGGAAGKGSGGSNVGGEAGDGAGGSVGGKGGAGGTSGDAGGGGTGATPACGNGDVDTDEECDLGEDNGETNCAYGETSCNVCTEDCQRATGVTAFCGDRRVQASEEDCDDANGVDETCAYGDSACTGCDGDCNSLARSCGDRVVNGETLTGITLDYVGVWNNCPTYDTLPLYINGVPIPNVREGGCTCGESGIQMVTVTDPAVLAALRPDDNVVEMRGILDDVYDSYAYLTWLRMTFSFASSPDVVQVVFDPHGRVGTPYLCYTPEDPATNFASTGYIVAPPFGGLPVEQCDGGSDCTDCQAGTIPGSCAEIHAADSGAADGPYLIDPTGGTASDAAPAYCDMSGGGTTYSGLGMGSADGSYSGYSRIGAVDFRSPPGLSAFIWLYNIQGGFKNLAPGWTSENCCVQDLGSAAMLSLGSYVLFPADFTQTDGAYHCNGPAYTDPILRMTGVYSDDAMTGSYTSFLPPLTPSFLSYYPPNAVTGGDSFEYAGCNLDVGNPALFLQSY